LGIFRVFCQTLISSLPPFESPHRNFETLQNIMEEITSEVSKIQSTLHSSRSQLRLVETGAKKAISLEVDSLRCSLKNGHNRVEHTTTQVRSFLSQIEDIDNSTSVDLKSQVVWLHDNLQVIVSDLDAAKAKADSSIRCTEQFRYKVMDVGQEVDSSSNKLTEFLNDAAKLEAQARSSLTSSQSMLEYAQAQIRRKEQEIREKIAEAASKRLRRKQLENDLANKREQIARAERERQERKEQAIASAVCTSLVFLTASIHFTNAEKGLGLLGILGAPFTGGASLALTVGAGGVAGYVIYQPSSYWKRHEDSLDADTKPAEWTTFGRKLTYTVILSVV